MKFGCLEIKYYLCDGENIIPMEYKEEIWRYVVGLEGKYEVSNLGRVRSLPRYLKCKGAALRFHNGKILSPSKRGNYLFVVLAPSKKMYYVHRLVAMAFLPNPNNYPMVNHKDENSSNNNVDNLEWCTCKYNNNYSHVGTKINLKRRKPIKAINIKTGDVKRFVSMADAARQGFDKKSIRLCIRGEKSKYKGCIWCVA